MSGIARLWLMLAGGLLVNLIGGAAAAAVAEWNPVRTHPVQLGPEAHRLIVGFRASPANGVVTTVTLRRAQSIKLVQAKTSDADVAGLAARAGVALAKSRQITPGMHVLFLQKTLYGAEVHAALKKLRADPSVEFADVDQRRYPHAVPDDPLFQPTPGVASGQWYLQPPDAAVITLGGTPTQDLSGTDAVSAWNLTKGSPGIVIADVDTGVRFDHPDLLRAGFDSSTAGFGGRLLPGYDFVGEDLNSNTGAPLGTFLIANDGDAWDPDPSDPGDWIDSTDLKNSLFPPAQCGDPSNNNGPTNSSWHGTRVMGILGALTNNGVGIAGMTWNSYLLPVRALGKCGGYDSDIIAGMQWAAGMSVQDPAGNTVPVNPYPADIINLSLGGAGSCPSAYGSVITTLTNMGVVVVASAGNENGAVEAPGNCAGVLGVAGLRNVGTKVGYSSFGAQVGIAAPAGNCVTSTGTCYRSIDTTVNFGLKTPAANGYTDETNFNLGTSFSAPIVSGIAALMRAVNANLTPPQLIARIKASASPFPPNTGNIPVCPATDPTTQECSCVVGQCGAGMVNALRAVQAALNPIAVITNAGSNTAFDAGGSVAACGLTVASYAWTASGGIVIQSGANAPQVTVVSTGTAGTLTLTVTDSTGRRDTGTVSFTSTGSATVNAPASAGTAASSCPAPLTVTPMAPTVTEAFSPASVGMNVAATLTITFTNPNGFALTQAGFTETMPANLSVQTSPAPTTTCSGASGTLTSSASTVTLAGANIPANGSCTLTMNVMSPMAGTYTNTIAARALSTGPAGSSSASATASLTVAAPPSGGGGGGLAWLDLMFAAGVLLAGRRHAGRP
jgi:serine protease